MYGDMHWIWKSGQMVLNLLIYSSQVAIADDRKYLSILANFL